MTEDYGLPLAEAARRTGVTVVPGGEPQDREVEANGLRLHYLDWGGDALPLLLCIHGYAQNAHSWDFTALALRDRYRVLALDLRGHGDSQWAPDGDYTQPGYLADLEPFIDAVAPGPLVVVGLSLGGSLAYSYAARHPERVRTLVVVDTGPETTGPGRGRIRRFVRQPDVLDSFEAFVARTRRYNSRRPEWQVRGSLRHNLRRLPDGRWTWKYDPALRRRRRPGPPPDPSARWATWAQVRCPTLLVRGASSDLLDAGVAQRMAEMLPNVRLVEVPNAGHLVPGDNPVGFEEALTGFLGEQEAAAS